MSMAPTVKMSMRRRTWATEETARYANEQAEGARVRTEVGLAPIRGARESRSELGEVPVLRVVKAVRASGAC
jgi:hypothetical protein